MGFLGVNGNRKSIPNTKKFEAQANNVSFTHGMGVAEVGSIVGGLYSLMVLFRAGFYGYTGSGIWGDAGWR
jgi:hypothetical protein